METSTSDSNKDDDADDSEEDALEDLPVPSWLRSTWSKRWKLMPWLIHTTVFLFVLDAGISPYWPPSRYDVDLDIFRSVPLGPTRARVHVRFPYPFGE